MNISKKQLFIGILVLVVAVAAGLWGVFSAEQSEPTDTDEPTVTGITANEESITDQNGNTLVEVDNLPGGIQVSEDASFGASGAISGAQLSPDNEWIAFATRGAAHDAGWLYEVASEEVTPVAFQYGGGIEVVEWSPDAQFIAFQAGTPAPSEHIVLVDRTDIDGYVSEVSHQIEVDAQAGVNPPFAYEFNRWEEPHTICFTFEEQGEQCLEAEQVMGDGSDDQDDDSDQEPAEDERSVQLYYYNADEDTDDQGNIMCSEAGLVSVERKISGIQTPITSTVELLLEGSITEAEQQQGITTEFPLEGFQLEGVNLEDGVATLEFSDPQNSSSGGSCRVTILQEQIRQTVLQFDAVDEAQIIPEDILQP